LSEAIVDSDVLSQIWGCQPCALWIHSFEQLRSDEVLVERPALGGIEVDLELELKVRGSSLIWPL